MTYTQAEQASALQSRLKAKGLSQSPTSPNSQISSSPPKHPSPPQRSPPHAHSCALPQTCPHTYPAYPPGPMPIPQLASGRLLDEHLAARPKTNLPAIFMAATNAEETLYFNQAGDKVFGHPEEGQVKDSTPVELYSQTKVVTAVACLQLVDRGLVRLDSPDDIDRWLPELKHLRILTGYDRTGNAVFEDPEKRITLRQLLSHSSGLVYPQYPSLITEHSKRAGIPMTFQAPGGAEVLLAPLIYEPGESWTYSQSIDLAGVLVERVSGESLHDYFRSKIFLPLGADSMTCWPTEAVRRSKMWLCVRDPDTDEIILAPGGFGLKRPQTVAEQERCLLLGGGALYGTQRDYLKFLRGLLRCDARYIPSIRENDRGPYASPGGDVPDENFRLLTPESYNELFTPCITPAGREELAAFVARWQNVPPLATPDNISHSVGFALNVDGMTSVGRRKAGSGFWGGAAKTNYWLDPASGLAGIVGTSLYWKGLDPWEEYAAEYERRLYASIV